MWNATINVPIVRYGISHLYIVFSDIRHLSLENIGRLARMSVLDTELDGSNPGSSMLFP